MHVNLALRQCNTCLEYLTIGEFYPVTIRQNGYEWHGRRPFCKSCNSDKCREQARKNADGRHIAAYKRRVSSVQLTPWESPSEKELRAYKERVSAITHIPPYETKNERSKRLWWENREKNLERKREYNSRPETKKLAREWSRYYLSTDHGRAVYVDKEARRRARKRDTASGYIADAIQSIKSQETVTCHICGEDLPGCQCEIDHIVPLSRGGTHTEDNIAPAHPGCNRRKSARLMCELERRWLS